MKLIVITPSKDMPLEQDIVVKMFENGLNTLHIRKSKHTTLQIQDYINNIPKHFHNRIVLHSHHKLALKFNLKGIHLGSIHLSKHWEYWLVRLRLKLKYTNIHKSRSYSRIQQVYLTENHDFNYCLIGTMYNNLTSKLFSGFYEESLLAAIKSCGKNLVAKGGTSEKNIETTHQLGFYGIAFNSYIWKAKDPLGNFIKIIKKMKELGIEIN